MLTVGCGAGQNGELSRVLKKSASGVLAALRGSTYRSVRLASSLAAVLLDGLFEHPTWCSPVVLSSNRMLKKSASGVLAALRGSTYRSVRLASSLAAVLLDGLFEHPA